jgi:MoxR-like ATPase
LTDRRIVRAQSLVAAATVLRGQGTADARDLWPLVYVVPTALEQGTARDVLRELLQSSESALSAAALDASWGPRARATRIVEAAEQILATEPAESERSSWKLRLEGIAREIDASFSRDQLPEPLPSLRERIQLLLA